MVIKTRLLLACRPHTSIWLPVYNFWKYFKESEKFFEAIGRRVGWGCDASLYSASLMFCVTGNCRLPVANQGPFNFPFGNPAFPQRLFSPLRSVGLSSDVCSKGSLTWVPLISKVRLDAYEREVAHTYYETNLYLQLTFFVSLQLSLSLGWQHQQGPKGYNIKHRFPLKCRLS